jgi:hypothetical protein
VTPDTAISLATTFGTTVSSFPQTYLGLPLSPHKISVSDCLPLISSCDKYLSGWRATLLNRAGRLTLTTSVLSAVPLHYMSALNVPKTVIKAIDRRRRAFFWTGKDTCHGSKCLVAWETVQTTKASGGLGVKDLHLQNRCLLMKFINKLFSAEPVAWKEWLLRDTTGFDAPVSDSHSFLWKIINDELNAYRSITYVQIRDGSSTSFWFDHWLPSGPICTSHAALFSHTVRPNLSVQCVFQQGLDLCLRPQLTNAASAQLEELLSCLQEVTLGGGADICLLKTTGRPFTTRDAYAALDAAQGSQDYHSIRIWAVRVPNKVKIFAWLYFKNMLSTRANLYAKHVLDDNQCQRCVHGIEDKHHTFFQCATSNAVWRTLGFYGVSFLRDEDIWDFATPPQLDERLWPFVLLTILWRLWEARNGEIFRHERNSTRLVLARVCDDFVILRKRLKNVGLVNSLSDWRAYILSCISATRSR